MPDDLAAGENRLLKGCPPIVFTCDGKSMNSFTQ
jgi:hypothetical protein